MGKARAAAYQAKKREQPKRYAIKKEPRLCAICQLPMIGIHSTYKMHSACRTLRRLRLINESFRIAAERPRPAPKRREK
jgi:hypothetical protein